MTHATDLLDTVQRGRPLSIAGRLTYTDCCWFVGDKAIPQTAFCHLAKEDVPFPQLSTLAMGLGRVQEYERALRVCKRAMVLAPDFPEAKYGVVYYMAKAGYAAEDIFSVIHEMVELAPHIFHYR